MQMPGSMLSQAAPGASGPEKAGLELHRLLVLAGQGDRQRSGGYRARNAGSSHPLPASPHLHPCSVASRGSVNICGLHNFPGPNFHFLWPVPPPEALITHPSLLTSGHNPCSWPSVLRKFVIIKKEFPCREKGEGKMASLWEQNCLIHSNPTVVLK